MRVGDFSVEVIAANGPGVREVESGHVLARPGQVYFLRLRNHGPLRAVADVTIDGHVVTGGGLVIGPWSTADLERPVHRTERGRFTVIAEGDEAVFGPDGGRDNADLGLIEARFRRELPESTRWEVAPSPDALPGRPATPPEWTPPTWGAPSGRHEDRRGDAPASRGPLAGETRNRGSLDGSVWSRLTALLDSRSAAAGSPPVTREVDPGDVPRNGVLRRTGLPEEVAGDLIERAAGTGLTSTSDQEFVPVRVGLLEAEATVIRLRLVVASGEGLAAARPLPGAIATATPGRPAPRP